ncbi:MAG: FeoA family protein [Planctomycetota bacterium]
MPTTLDTIQPGNRCRVTGFTGSGAIKRRLMDMGLIRRSAIEVLRVAPLGDPIEITVRGYQLSLRREEAALVEVETESEAGKDAES